MIHFTTEIPERPAGRDLWRSESSATRPGGSRGGWSGPTAQTTTRGRVHSAPGTGIYITIIMYHKLWICIKYCRAPLFYLVKRLNNIACRIFNSEGKMKLIFAIGDLQYTVLHFVLGLALRGDINMSTQGKG